MYINRLSKLKTILGDAAFILRHNPAGIVGLVILMFFIGMAVFAPYISPFDPDDRVARPLTQPNSVNLLGTNDIGNDILSELIWGSRVSLSIGFSVALVVMVIGTSLGITAGYFGGIVDEVLMRFADIIIVLPGLPLMIIIASLIGTHSIRVIILVMSLTSWGGLARMVRSVTLSLKERTFIEASRALGAGNKRIIIKHLLPNTTPIILSAVIYRVVGAIMTEASLAFLGIGDLRAKSWGMILHFAQTSGGWYGNRGEPMWSWIIPPGLCIAFVALGLMLVGQVIEEIVNPKLRVRR